MKKNGLFLTFLAAGFVSAVYLASCSQPVFPSGSMNYNEWDPGNQGHFSIVPRLNYLRQNAQDGGVYDVWVKSDEALQATQIIHFPGRQNVTIQIQSYGGTRRILSLDSDSAMFQVQGDTTLILYDIFLQGHGSNNHALLVVNQNSTLKMDNDSVIRGNYGKGVLVNGGVLTLSSNAAITAGGSEGVHVIKGRVCINDTAQIYNNVSGIIASDSIITMRNSAAIRNNHTRGGISISGASARLLMFKNAQIHNNTFAGQIRGAGGVYAKNYSRIYMYENASIHSNHNYSYLGGGGVKLLGSSALNMHGNDVNIRNNRSVSQGAGVLAAGSHVNISAGTIYGSSSTWSPGPNSNWNTSGINPPARHALHLISSWMSILSTARTGEYFPCSNGPGTFNPNPTVRLSSCTTITVSTNGTSVLW